MADLSQIKLPNNSTYNLKDAKARDDFDNLKIGGRNLLRYHVYNYADGNGVLAVNSSYRGMYCAIDGGETYTISRKVIEGNRFWIEWSEQEPSSGTSLYALSKDNTAMKVTVNVPSEANWLFIYLSNQGDEIHDGNIKIERGTKSTDWTPAPEDVAADISTAQTTANNAQTAANNAQTAANNAQADIDGLKIGGRNLLVYSTMREYYGGGIRAAGSYYSIINNEIVATSQPLSAPLPGWQLPIGEYVLSGTTSLISVAIWVQGYNSSDQKVGGQKSKYAQVDSNGYFETMIADLILEGSSYFNIGIGSNSVANYSIKPKLEKGNRATDWTPAPEDKADVADTGILESPYTEVEWVESNGKQFVYLDWKPKIATWGFEADFIIRNTFNSTQAAWDPSVNANNAGCIFGTRNSGSTNDIEFLSYSANGMLRIGNGTNQTVAATFKKDKTRQTIKLIGTTLTNADGTTKTVTRVSETANKPYSNMAVFAYYEGLRRMATGNLLYPGSIRIYSLKFYDSTTLECDLVGAIRKSDGVTGLYDKIAKHFYPAPGMTHGDAVGDLGNPITLADGFKRATLTTIVNNITDRRMWFANVPELESLEDGQKLAVTPMYTVVASDQTSKLVGWDDTSASNNYVYMKLILANNVETDWIPCYFSPTARLTTHYGSGAPILFTYRENVFAGATNTAAGSTIMRAWYADVNYDTNTNTTFSKLNSAGIAGANGLKRYSLCMRDSSGLWTSIINQDNTVATTKTCYTGGFDPTGGVAYAAFNAVYAAGASSGDGMWESYGDIDLRYSLNIGTTVDTGLIQRTPLYLVGTIGSDGLFYLDQTKWWTQTPNDSTKVYIFISDCRADYYRAFLAVKNPLYIYDGTKLVEFDDQRIRTAENKLAGIASGAEVNQNAFSNIKVGSTTVSADIKTDTLELAGSNVTLTPDATNDKVTIGISASNVTAALGNTAVARATGDASGNAIASTYVKKSGDTMSGLLTLKADQYGDSYTSGALNLSNSNIYGVNSVYTADLSDDSKEGIHFYRDATHVDSLWAKQGTLYFTPNRALNDTGTSYAVLNTSSNVSEANLVWGGKNFSASYGPIDAAMVTDLGANRIACISGDAVTIEYSRDKGVTWTDYGATKAQKGSLFAQGNGFYIGKADSTNKATANGDLYQLRVTIDTGAANVYTTLNKFVFYVSTAGSNSCTVKIEKALQSTPTTFVDHTSDVPIAGWSGWNVVNTSGLTTYGNTASSQYGRLRFIFKANGGDTAYTGLGVHRIMAFGGVGWNAPSNMAKTGHLYTYDQDQNAVFPAKITATGGFSGNLTGNATNVTGVVAVANGGTGQTSLNDSANSLINSLTAGTDVPKDADYYICQFANGGTSTTTYHRRPTSKIYDYIVGKSKNLTAVGNLGWTTQAAGKIPLLVNGIAYWNGRYNATNSNLEYCKKGAFGTAAVADLSTATNSTSTATAATSSAVKTAYDLANTANGTANTALSGVNGSYIYDHTYTIANGVATFTAHVYLKGEEVTSTFADSCFTWSYKLADSVTGTPSIVSLGTGKTKTITISTLGYGGYVQGTFTPPSS